MQVASLELCKTLHELSGWDDTYLRWTNFNPATVVNADEWANHEERLHHLELVGDDVLEEASAAPYPAYDLGYLLRKLRVGWALSVRLEYLDVEHEGRWWEAEFTQDVRPVTTKVQADSPEDAAAKLAIELFKQGVLTKPEKEG